MTCCPGERFCCRVCIILCLFQPDKLNTTLTRRGLLAAGAWRTETFANTPLVWCWCAPPLPVCPAFLNCSSFALNFIYKLNIDDLPSLLFIHHQSIFHLCPVVQRCSQNGSVCQSARQEVLSRQLRRRPPGALQQAARCLTQGHTAWRLVTFG